VETIDYFLRRYREDVIRKRKAAEDIEAQLAALEAQLRRKGGVPSPEPDTAESGPPPFERVGTQPEVQEMAAD
jgi:hypothetical protein